MRKIKRAAALVGVAATVAVPLATSGTANASTASVAAANPCGSGYTLRGTLPVGESSEAQIRFYRSDGSHACAATFKLGKAVGNNVKIGVWIDARPGGADSDVGRYREYAGPVKVTGTCVNWGGGYGEYNNSNQPCR
ncbi:MULTISPECIES: serine/threonine protein kinase [Actinomadura]|uniref:Serine/threonine protein kinase n=1 Tax=Actinomadura litoris TaxID=2678616 RepID=A0A7K1KSE2_9ACTN|nr:MULTISPECIES: serine/threonine protein kinase [Actinomadura]MBT2208057.1 hypothetical protein [Actinomadura sp. NEAU-AAG7]MUN35100.1 serine/threonine protein kinase [Actinomadura litoris]